MSTIAASFAQVADAIRKQNDNEIIISERSGSKFNIEVITDSKSITNKKLIDILFMDSYAGDPLEELDKLLTSVTDFPEEFLEEDKTILIIKKLYGKSFKVGILSI